MSNTLALEYLENYKEKTDPLLKKYLKAKIIEASEIGNTPKNILSQFAQIANSGKRIRGALVVLGYEIAGGNQNQEIFDASISMELFHAGLLVHDDIMDNSEIRRGITTIHKQFEKKAKILNATTSPKLYGQSLAICAGDGAFYLSWEKLANSGFSADKILKASKVFTKYAFRVMNGQMLDISLSQKKTVNEKDLLNMMYLKTGEYTCKMPLALGIALAGRINQDKYRSLMKYSKNLGWLFQIQDDILGIFGNEKTLGKPNTSDLSQGKMTLLMLHLKNNANQKQKTLQKEILGKNNITQKDVLYMRRILKESGSYDYVLNLASSYLNKGKKQIPSITEDRKLQNILESFLIFAVERRS